MRTIYQSPLAVLALLCLLLPTHSRAQNVGIGTNAPAQRLHVAGNIRTDSALVVVPAWQCPMPAGRFRPRPTWARW